jgi:precorrin-2 dehydrogenase/sirohydrochlorin ferrochelatase
VTNSSNYLPIFINVKGLKVLVVGGGLVGSRRAIKLAKAGADVTVISLEFSKELESLKDSLNIKTMKSDAKELNKEFLSQFDLIFACTNNVKINNQICEMARSLGKLCNNTLDANLSSFILPIYYEDEDFGIAVTTFGKSSLVAELILNMIREKVITTDVKNLVRVMGDVKAILKNKINDPKIRHSMYLTIFNDKIFSQYIYSNNLDLALKRAEEIINGYTK